MIISVSRRTDIPAFYSEWFYNRVKEGCVLVRNPHNFRQISRIRLTPGAVDSFVFWTKNPGPMLPRLHELNDYMYYFQFTVTPYSLDIEPNVPSMNEGIALFKEVSEIVGAERVIWRYDPVLLNKKYNLDFHKSAFSEMAKSLHRHTHKVTISFVDAGYRGAKANKNALCLDVFQDGAKRELAAMFAAIAKSYGLAIDSCAEKLDLQECGIEPANCVDGKLLQQLLNNELIFKKDKNQRPACGCAASIDIGMYNTCMNGCLYCYANYNRSAVNTNFARHNPLSPLLYGEVGPEDVILSAERK